MGRGGPHAGMGGGSAKGSRCSLTCRVVDRGPSGVEWVLGSRTARWVHEARLWGCGASFGILGVRVHWLHWEACHWNLLA